MSKRSGRQAKGPGGDVVERVHALVRERDGDFHRLEPPAAFVAPELPGSVAAVCRAFDGAELFFETLILHPSARIERLDTGPGAGEVACHLVGALEGDALAVDARDRVYRFDENTEEWLPEGSDFARWLLGTIEALSLLYDAEGEFSDEAFDEAGDPTLEMSARMHRAILLRDRKAPAPRWRLARALALGGDIDKARDHLEQVVADAPDFPAAWYDLGRTNEALGQPESALEEFVVAAQARVGDPYAAYYWAHAARLAAHLGDEPRRAEYAAKALGLDPDIARNQREGALALLEEEQPEEALDLCRLALALAPRDLVLVDLLARLDRG